MLLLALHACQQPFNADRHDLIGDRILAIEAQRLGDVVVPTATLLRNGQLWTDETDELRWFVLSGDPEESILQADPNAPDAVGPAPQFTAYTQAIGLRFREKWAWIELTNQTDLSFTGILQNTVSQRLDSQEATSLSMEERSSWGTEDASFFPPGEIGRFQATFPDGDFNPTVRWMSTAGTFLELDRTTVDWAPATLTIDDDDLIVEDSIWGGVFPLVALAIDPIHGNRVRVQEFHVGEPAIGVWTNSGRWIPADEATNSEWIEATLVEEDTPTGLRLTNVTVALPDLSDPDPYGTLALDCEVPLQGPFDPNVLVDGRCSRAKVIEHRVILQVIP